MSGRTVFLILAFFTGLLGACGDGLFTSWAQKDKVWHLVIGWIMCNIALGILAYALKKGTLVEATVIYTVVSDVLILLISMFIFKEAVSTRAYYGAIIAILGAVMMQLK
jgi:uncharacterized membrane protein